MFIKFTNVLTNGCNVAAMWLTFGWFLADMWPACSQLVARVVNLWLICLQCGCHLIKIKHVRFSFV